MDIKEFKKYTHNLDRYTAEEVDEFEFMTGEELDTYQNELEIDSGNVSNWDHLRALITLKKMLTDRHSQIIKAYNTKEIASEQDGKIEPRTRDWFDVNDF